MKCSDLFKIQLTRHTFTMISFFFQIKVFSLIAIALNWMLYYRHMNLGAKTVFNIYVFNFFRIFSLMASILYGLTFWQNMGERNQYRNQGGGPTETYGAICSARVTMNMTIDLVAQIFFFFSVAPELFKGAAIFVSLFISLPRKASFHKFLIDSPFMLLLMLLNAEHRALTGKYNLCANRKWFTFGYIYLCIHSEQCISCDLIFDLTSY